jgi:Tol biopolymer transport system component
LRSSALTEIKLLPVFHLFYVAGGIGESARRRARYNRCMMHRGWYGFLFRFTGALVAGLAALVVSVPRLLPSSDQISFESNITGYWDIYLLDLRTGVIHNLTRYRADDRAASWSPDGEQLVFYSNRASELSGDIYVLDVLAGGVRWLTWGDRHHWRPVWSPDNDRITLMVSYDRIYIMDSDGRNAVQLAVGFAPSWSPDSQYILYYTSRYGELNADIYALRPDGTGFRNLSRHPANDWDPAWSPDGGRVAFTSARHGNAEIYVMTVCEPDQAGCDSSVQRLTFHRATDKTPAWSPDGRYIVFESERDGTAQLYMVEADCGGSEQTCHARPLTWGGGSKRYPAWRP